MGVATAQPLLDEQLALCPVIVAEKVDVPTVQVVVAVHPVLSVTTTVYVPADKPDAVAVVAPPGDHK